MFKDYFQSFLVLIGKHWLLRVTPYSVSMKSMCGLLYEKIACWWTFHILMNDSQMFLRGTKSMKLQYLRDSRCTCHHWRLSKKVVAMNGGHWWDVRRMIQTSTPTKLAAIMHFASIRCPGPRVGCCVVFTPCFWIGVVGFFEIGSMTWGEVWLVVDCHDWGCWVLATVSFASICLISPPVSVGTKAADDIIW